MKAVDPAKLDAPAILALLTGAAHADQFCKGALFDFFESGCILKWLERLEEIDE